MEDSFLRKNIPSSKIPQINSLEINEKFSEKMFDIGIKEKEKEAKARGEGLGISYINLKGFPINPETLTLIDEQTSQRLKVITFYAGEDDVRIGAVDPMNGEVQKLFEKIKQRLFTQGKIYIISENSFGQAFRLYSVLPRIRKFSSGVQITETDFTRFENEIKSFKDLNTSIQKASLTDMVTVIIAVAIKSRSSDIHIECEENLIKVRYRIDGILTDVAEIDKSLWQKIIARIKLLSRLKINITDKPQDGRFTIFLTKETIDVRVSTLPTTYGESVVMRILMSSVVGLHFENLGLRGRAFEALKAEIDKPNGMVVTTGPTGSGKTTTLYAILNQLNNPGTKIITIEDPIEYKLEGINQSQVEPGKGYSFASGLKNILRQDPDIVMVGEVRDLETAEIAINAALTGHLVLTTL